MRSPSPTLKEKLVNIRKGVRSPSKSRTPSPNEGLLLLEEQKNEGGKDTRRKKDSSVDEKYSSTTSHFTLNTNVQKLKIYKTCL